MAQNEESNIPPSEFVYLHIDNKTIKVRRSLLIGHSLHLREVLRFWPNSCTISLDNLNFSVCDMILRWMHTSEIETELLSLPTMVNVHDTAVQLKIVALIKICEKLILEKFMASNVTDVYGFIEQHGTTDLFSSLRNILISSFEGVVKHPNFMRFNIDFVCMLLSDNDVVIDSEKIVFDSAVQWLNYDWENRKKYNLRVMSCVRMQLLSKQDLLLSSLRTSEFPGLEMPEVRTMFLNAFKYHAAVKTNQISRFPDLIPVSRTRVGTSRLNTGDIIVPNKCDVASGSEENLAKQSKNEVKLNLNANETEPLVVSTPTCSFTGRAGSDSIKTKPMSRSNLARWISSPMCTSRRPLPWQKLLRFYPHLNKQELAAIALQAFFRGFRVRNNLKILNEAARKIQKQYRKWKRTRIVNTKRSCVDIENKPLVGLIVIGGLDPGHKPLATASTVLYYDAQRNIWAPICATPVPFVQSACAMLDKRIYVTGGVILPTRSTPKSVSKSNWCFDHLTRLWTKCSDMLETRTCHALVAHCGKLIAIGGKDASENLLQSTEFYEPHLNRWINISPMNIPRMAMASAVYRNRIWVCGGATNDTDVNSVTITGSVECYHFNTNKWHIQLPLRIPRMSAMLIALSDMMVVLGGTAIDSRSMDAEVYMEGKDNWNIDHSLQMNRESAAVAILFDLIFLIGGYSAETNNVLSSVQCFLPGLNGEVNNITSLPYPLNGHCAVTI